jgi:hypothetical protein
MLLGSNRILSPLIDRVQSSPSRHGKDGTVRSRCPVPSLSSSFSHFEHTPPNPAMLGAYSMKRDSSMAAGIPVERKMGPEQRSNEAYRPSNTCASFNGRRNGIICGAQQRTTLAWLGLVRAEYLPRSVQMQMHGCRGGGVCHLFGSERQALLSPLLPHPTPLLISFFFPGPLTRTNSRLKPLLFANVIFFYSSLFGKHLFIALKREIVECRRPQPLCQPCCPSGQTFLHPSLSTHT